MSPVDYQKQYIYTHIFLSRCLVNHTFFFLLHCVVGAELPRERGWFIDTTQCRTPVVTFGSSLPHLDQFYYCTLSESFWPHGLLWYTHTHTCIYARSDPGCWRNCMWETLCSEVLFILSCSGWRLQIFSLGIFLIIWHCTPLIWSHMSSTFQPLLWQKKTKNRMNCSWYWQHKWTLFSFNVLVFFLFLFVFFPKLWINTVWETRCLQHAHSFTPSAAASHCVSKCELAHVTPRPMNIRSHSWLNMQRLL